MLWYWKGLPSLSANPRVLSLCEVADSLSPLVKKHCRRRPVRSMMRRRRRAHITFSGTLSTQCPGA